MRSETFHVLDHHEFNKLVNEHLKPSEEYEVVPDQEWNNDESHSYSAQQADYSSADRHDVAAYLRGEPDAWVSPGQLLSELADRGVIPWGEYIIEVSW